MNSTRLARLWNIAKRSRVVRMGPLALQVALRRRTRVTKSRTADLGQSTRSDRAIGQTTSPDVIKPRRNEPETHVALVVGVGAGLGEALALRFAKAGNTVVLATRDAKRLDGLIDRIRSDEGEAYSIPCDATNETSVRRMFAAVQERVGVPNVVVYSLQSSDRSLAVDVEVSAFEEAWKHNCLGAFIVSREAARRMVLLGRGTIVLIGSTSSILGRPNHLNLAVGKFGMRAVAQVLAKELWPKGVHVAHLLVDADIGESADWPTANPHDIADAIQMLHSQPRSAWTSELDVRPWNERFWEHC